MLMSHPEVLPKMGQMQGWDSSHSSWHLSGPADAANTLLLTLGNRGG